MDYERKRRKENEYSDGGGEDDYRRKKSKTSHRRGSDYGDDDYYSKSSRKDDERDSRDNSSSNVKDKRTIWDDKRDSRDNSSSSNVKDRRTIWDEKDKDSASSSESRSRKKSSNKKSHKKSSKSSKRSRSRSRNKSKDKKSKSSRHRSTSSSSSISSNNSVELMLKLEKQRAQQLKEDKLRKEKLKAMETPEEKRIRRLAKKEAKERKRKERMGWDSEYLHYTNTDNPFGDSNLLDSFVWKMKNEKEGLQEVSREEIERINRLKQAENKRELEKVKQRRELRERERQQREEEEALVQRQKEAAQFKEWGNQEDLFHLEQATLRSKIRIKDGRAKPIDLLAQYISAEQEVNAIEMHEPYTYLNGLTVTDLEDLIEDIKVYKELEKGKNLSYWNDITVIVDDELRKLRKLEQDDDYRIAMERREGINPAVAEDVASIFKGKSSEQLQTLKTQIQGKLDGSSSGVDISYWESLLSQLKAHIARAQLRDRHQDNLQKKLALLKAEQGVEAENEENEAALAAVSAALKLQQQQEQPSTSKTFDPNAIDIDETSRGSIMSSKSAAENENDEEEEEDEEETIIREAILKYVAGNFSPRLIGQNDIEPGIFVIGEEEDNTRLHLARTQVLNVGQKVENVWTAEEKALQMEAKKGMDNSEAVFSVESPVDQVYLWSDKYRPRKPRYFNRVHTGFEWNKYNQTHYDMDNPPPKIVQGYKFNIFYPDLIDKNSTPEYHLTACGDNPDFGILRFHAGPPYEDIAFKIVNREWEYSYKRGFRCQFHNNIFQLWFHFKRYRYRR